MESGACGKPLSQAADTTLQRALGDPVSIRRRSYSHFEARVAAGSRQCPDYQFGLQILIRLRRLLAANVSIGVLLHVKR